MESACNMESFTRPWQAAAAALRHEPRILHIGDPVPIEEAEWLRLSFSPRYC